MSDLVGLNVQTPNFTQTMSGLMGLRQQKQQLEQGQQALQQGKLETDKQQAVQDFYKDFDPTEATGADGSIDLNKVFSNKKFQSAGNAKPVIANHLIDIKNKQLQSTKALADLNGTLVTQFGTGLGALSSDPDVVADKTDPTTGINPGREKVAQFMQEFSGIDPSHAKIGGMYGLIANHAPNGKLATSLKTIQLQAQSASEQQGQQNPGQISLATGGNTNVYNVNKPTGEVNQNPVLSVAAPNQIVNLPSGQLGRATAGGANISPINTGNQSATKQVGFLNEDGSHRTAAQDMPPPNSPSSVIDNYNKATASANDHVQNVRDADEHYRTNVDISNKIRDLSRVTNTSPAMSYLQEKVGATNIQELGAYLDRQAAGLQTAMNLPHTNQGQEMAKDISGNVKYSPKAIQEKNDFNQSLVEGFHAYRKGLERVSGLAGNGSPVAINQFKSAWAENFDPNVFRAKAAYARNTEEGKAFVKSLSAQDAEKMLKDKKALELLSQGKLSE